VLGSPLRSDRRRSREFESHLPDFEGSNPSTKISRSQNMVLVHITAGQFWSWTLTVLCFGIVTGLLISMLFDRNKST